MKFRVPPICCPITTIMSSRQAQKAATQVVKFVAPQVNEAESEDRPGVVLVEDSYLELHADSGSLPR